MTNNISPDNIDTAQIAKLVQEYNQIDDREEQRRIENEVLAETVWQTPQSRSQQDGLTLSRADWERLYAEIPDDAKEAKRILRSFYVERL